MTHTKLQWVFRWNKFNHYFCRPCLQFLSIFWAPRLHASAQSLWCFAVIGCSFQYTFFFPFFSFLNAHNLLSCWLEKGSIVIPPASPLCHALQARGVTPLRAAIFLPSSWHTRVVLINWCVSAGHRGEHLLPRAHAAGRGHFSAVCPADPIRAATSTKPNCWNWKRLQVKCNRHFSNCVF